MPLFGAFQKRNRQGDLLKKLEIAKEQARLRGGESGDETKYKLTDEEVKAVNDRKRFEELLNSESATSYDMENSSLYKTMEQEEEEMNAGCKWHNSPLSSCHVQIFNQLYHI
jgi:hypothetical protein